MKKADGFLKKKFRTTGEADIIALTKLAATLQQKKMVKPENMENDGDISLARALDLFGNRWKLRIINGLMKGPKRFTALRKQITGINEKVLTENLRSLECDGFINREYYAEIPPRVEYSLNGLGASLRGVIGEMEKWSVTYLRPVCEVEK